MVLVTAGWCGWSGCGDDPVTVAAGQSEDEESSEVEPGDAVMQPVIVLGHASVADPPVASGEPGDAAFDHWPVTAVNRLKVWCLSLPASGTEQSFVRVNLDGPATVARGALRAQRASHAT